MPELIDIINIPEVRPYDDPTLLQQKYIVEKASLAQIAKEFSCSKHAIRNALTRAGIPVRRRAQPGFAALGYGTRNVRGRRVDDQIEQRVINSIIELREDGMSYDKIASFLTKMGVPTKTRRRKWNGGCIRVIYLRHKNGLDNGR